MVVSVSLSVCLNAVCEGMSVAEIVVVSSVVPVLPVAKESGYECVSGNVACVRMGLCLTQLVFLSAMFKWDCYL